MPLSRIQLRALQSEPLGEQPNKLQRARVLAGLTQVELAAKTGFEQTHISRIERGGYSRLPLEHARTLARELDCAIEDLFPEPDRITHERVSA